MIRLECGDRFPRYQPPQWSRLAAVDLVDGGFAETEQCAPGSRPWRETCQSSGSSPGSFWPLSQRCGLFCGLFAVSFRCRGLGYPPWAHLRMRRVTHQLSNGAAHFGDVFAADFLVARQSLEDVCKICDREDVVLH
jgi:hypothetical protein